MWCSHSKLPFTSALQVTALREDRKGLGRWEVSGEGVEFGMTGNVKDGMIQEDMWTNGWDECMDGGGKGVFFFFRFLSC